MKVATLLICLLVNTFLLAQTVGINTSNPKSLFEIANQNPMAPTITDGLLVPRVSVFTTDTVETDSFGLWLYNATTTQNYYWDAPNGGFESFRNTLDQAYDCNGFGIGRTIDATSGALQINGDGLQVTGIFGNGTPLTNTSSSNGFLFYPKKGTLAFNTHPTTFSDTVLGNYNFQGRFPDDDVDYGSMFGNSYLDRGNYSTVFGSSSARGNGALVMGLGFAGGTQQESVVIGANGLNFTHGKNLVLGNNGTYATTNNLIIGVGNTVVNVSGQFNFSFGFIVGNFNAIGDNYAAGTILGFNNNIQGNAFIIGNSNTLLGGLNIGRYLHGYTNRQITFGAYNTMYTPEPQDYYSLVPNNRLFVIGNGTPTANSDALVMLEDGRTGFGNSFPKTHTDVNGGYAINPSETTITSPGQLLEIKNVSYIRLQSTSIPAARTITLENGLIHGQVLFIECIATGINGVQIPANLTNASIGSIALNLEEGDTLSLFWNGSKWLKLGSSNN